MPHLWTLDHTELGPALPAVTVSALLDVASASAGAEGLLRAVQTLVPADYLSWVRIHRDVPELVEGSARRPQDAGVVSQCFSIYRRRYYRSDRILPMAAELALEPSPGMAVLHCRADELPDAGWRSDIYERERLTDRFSLMHAPSPGQVQIIHIYRDDRLGALRPEEVDRLIGLAPLLCQAHTAAWRAEGQRQDRLQRILEREQRLSLIAPALSARERAVCARIADGWTADGIAVDLDVAPSTVITLRKRAYLKLADAGLPAERLGLARLLH